MNFEERNHWRATMSESPLEQMAFQRELKAGHFVFEFDTPGIGCILEQEPPDAGDPLLTLDNVIVTPHALCWTDQVFAGSGAADVRAVLAIMAGRVPTGIVNRDIVDRPGWQARLRGYAQQFGGD